MSVVVGAATPADAAAVGALEDLLFGPDAWSAASVTEELTGPRRTAVVAREDDAVVGYAVTLHGDDLVDLQRVAVVPERRRAGLARTLLAAVTAAAPAGATRMLLEVGSGNVAARAFYAAEGFEQIDRRPRYYRDGSDALVLSRPVAARAAEEEDA